MAKTAAVPNSANPLPISDFWESLEAGNYGRAWDKAAPYFQRDISKDDWVAKMERERRPLGKSVDRQLVSITTLTPMIRTVMEILATFANGRQLVEGAITAVQPDDAWRVEKYYARPATSEAVAQARANLARLSRFSRTAIAGAGWGALAFLIFGLRQIGVMLFPEGLSQILTSQHPSV